MHRTHSLVAASAAAFAACSGASAHVDSIPVPAVAAAAEPDSPEKLARLIAAGADAATIDAAAHQKYASVSHLYWYTDLDEAKRAAKAAGKPILSLRMLGRLDEDQSCANSRFFRVVLYANASLSGWLRDHFVLHWSSERAVPKLTIDMGDGRRIETTVGGNSAHYVLDADGRVLDVLPGLMTPLAFRHELEGALELAGELAAAPAQDRAAVLERHHLAAGEVIGDEWKKLGVDVIPEQTYATAIADAERLSMSKMMVERKPVMMAKLGENPSDLPAESAAWEQIGVHLLADLGLEHGEAAPAVPGAVAAPPAVLDDQSRALLATLAPVDWGHPDQALDAQALDKLVRVFEGNVVADTAQNLLRLRAAIHAQLGSYARYDMASDFATVNEWIYASLFRTPSYDAWLGLATPTTFTGLPRSGVVAGSPRE